MYPLYLQHRDEVTHGFTGQAVDVDTLHRLPAAVARPFNGVPKEIIVDDGVDHPKGRQISTVRVVLDRDDDHAGPGNMSVVCHAVLTRILRPSPNEVVQKVLHYRSRDFSRALKSRAYT